MMDWIPDEPCAEFVSNSNEFIAGSDTLVRSLRHIHRGLFEENARLSYCQARTKVIVQHRHQEALSKVIHLLKLYALNLLAIHADYVIIVKNRKKCSHQQYLKVEDKKKQMNLQRDVVLRGVENIVKCQLQYLSESFVTGSNGLESEDVFKVIRTYNLVLENLKRGLEIEDENEKEKEECDDLANRLDVPSTSKKKQPDPPPPPIEKLKLTLTSECMVSPTASLKKFTASRILQCIGSMRTREVTEYIAEALLSRIDVPSENNDIKVHLPWQPVNYMKSLSTYPNMDIFEEALAKEEDENRLNQKKLDMALRQEFGDDFPGTDYLPASECTDALRPLTSANMDQLIKTNTRLFELLLKKFLNTPGVMVPSLVKTGRYCELRVSKAGRTRLEGYYVDQIWGVGANLVDELLLWSPLIITTPRPSTSVATAPGVGQRGKGGVTSTGLTVDREVETSTGRCCSKDSDCTSQRTPSSDRSTTSSTASATTIVSNTPLLTPSDGGGNGGGVDEKSGIIKIMSKTPRLKTLSARRSGADKVYLNFLTPFALEASHLIYFQDAFNKYIRRGVLPGWCSEACEGVGAECGHLATQACLDRSLVLALGAYARRQPPPVRLPDGNYSTNGGVGLSGAVELLVWQVNLIEKTEPEKEEKDWPIADLVESLSVLCSVCSSGLCWLQHRSQCLLHTWTTAPYYLLTQADLPHLLTQLAKIVLEEREYLAKTESLHRALLVPYRERLVTIVHALLVDVKRLESVAVEALDGVCRTVALAHLQNAMPPPAVWRGVGRIPHEPHPYVAEYIGCVLGPVLDAVSQLGEALQRRAGCAVLKVVCYAWLEHIKRHRIAFSLWGAQQLLKDLAALSDWVRAYPGLQPGARTQVLAVDVLRECEGVARLLMRQPPLVVGYSSLNQVAPLTTIKAGREHDKAVKLSSEADDIPAEMYVPNQALWLSRRTRPASSLWVRAASCCTWPY